MPARRRRRWASPPSTRPAALGLERAIDGTDWSAFVIPEAARWAAALDLPLWFVQAIGDAPGRGRATADAVHELARAWRGTGIDVEWDLVADHRVARGLAGWLNEVPGTLTVAATHGRSGLQRGGLGGVSSQLVRQAKGPMVVQRAA